MVDVFVIEKSAAKRRYAEELGASEFIHTEKTDVRKAILDRTGGMGVDFAFECVGAQAALQTALAVTRPEKLAELLQTEAAAYRLAVGRANKMEIGQRLRARQCRRGLE